MKLLFQMQRAGQATVEYVLLLVVILLLGKVVVSPLGDGLKQWSYGLIGPRGYYACLMERAYLPGFTHDNEQNPAQGCGRKKSLSFEDLSAGLNGDGTNSGLNNSSSLSSSSSSSSSSNDSQSSKESSEAANKRSAENSKKRNSPRSSKFNSSGNSSSSSSPSSSSSSSSKNGGADSQFSSDHLAGLDQQERTSSPSRFKKRRSRRRKGNKGDTEILKLKNSSSSFENEEWGVGVLGSIPLPEEAQEEIKKKKESIKATTPSKQGFQISSKAHTEQIKKEKRRLLAEEKSRSLSFGAFLKWLFILAMIVILFVVIGSQVLAYKNAD